jgi:hypothetical protein
MPLRSNARPRSSAAWYAVTSLCTALLLLKLSPPAVSQDMTPLADEPHHRVVFENQYFRVLSLELPARSETPAYGSKNDSLLMAFADFKLTEVRPGHEVDLLMARGEPRFFAGGVVHKLRNATDTAFRGATVEILIPRSPFPPEPKCDCKPTTPGGGCLCGSAGTPVLMGDGVGHWVHQSTEGQVTVGTYGLRPIAMFTPVSRPGPLPELRVEPGDHGKLLIAADDIDYRLEVSDTQHISRLSCGDSLWVTQVIWIKYPQPATCTWDNFLIAGKLSPACQPSVFVLLEPRLPQTSPH